MNNYPIWWDSTITVYNKYQDPQTRVVRWVRNVINGVFWKATGDKVIIGNTSIDTGKILCRIRKDSRYLPKHEWLQIPNDSMPDYFTLGKGDIIVYGEVEDEINEGQAGHRSTDLIAKYSNLQGCMSIEEIAINIGAGRVNEHYLVKGK